MSISIPCGAVDDLPINPSLISKLKKANFLYAKKVLNFSLPELQRIVKVSASEAKIIVQAASTSESKSSETDALSKMKNSNESKNHLPFSFFDSSLFSGIYTGTITEICGESGCGKTQLCLLASICALVPGTLGENTSKVLYIHSEGQFPIQRFVELSEAFKKKNPAYKNVNFTDNLVLKKVYNLKETLRVLQSGIPELMKQKNCPKITIIDSVAELLRGEYDSFSIRNLMLQQLAAEIWKLANLYNMAVICVNQVSGSIQKNSASNLVSTDIPSLGLMWANVLTTRIKLFRQYSPGDAVMRAFEVVYSSYHPRLIINFVITSEGVRTLDEYLL